MDSRQQFMVKACRAVERRILRILHDHKTRKQLRQIHAHFLRHGLQQSNQVLAHFVSVCGSLHKMAYATRVFDQSHNPNLLLFNSMIKGYSLCGPFDHPMKLFSMMKRRGVWPDEYTFAPLLKACSNVKDYRIGQCVCSHILRTGFERFTPVSIGIVELCVRGSRMEDAQKVFEEMTQRDVIVWNLMIRGFCDAGDVDTGLRLFRRMSEQSVVSWNSMISSLARSGRYISALLLFGEMRIQGFEPDDSTVVTILPVCARVGDFALGKFIHSYIVSKGLLREVISVGNSLMDFYHKCGSFESAYSIFNQMHHKDTISWNVMISGMALNGNGQLGIKLFDEMVEIGTKPNESTFVGVLACCAHAGLVEKGREIFASMSRTHGIKPNFKHYGGLVDILGRNGLVEEAYEEIRRMPMKPNAVLWGSLLSSCRSFRNLEIAQIALHKLIGLEPWNPGNYVLLSNMCAEEGRWDEVDKLRELMRENCGGKSPGHSAVGLGISR